MTSDQVELAQRYWWEVVLEKLRQGHGDSAAVKAANGLAESFNEKFGIKITTRPKKG